VKSLAYAFLPISLDVGHPVISGLSDFVG